MLETPTPKPLLIPEIREMIILQLDPSTILTTGVRISREWKDLIDRSPAIRRMLVFEPSSSSIAKPYAYSERSGGVPLYNECFRVSPALEVLSNAWTPPGRMLWGVIVKEAPQYMPETAGKGHIRFRRESALYTEPSGPEGSWRRMFITDPPCTTALVRIERLSIWPLHWESEATFSIRDRSSIKLGHCEDAVQAALSSSHKYRQGDEAETGVRTEAYVDSLCSQV